MSKFSFFVLFLVALICEISDAEALFSEVNSEPYRTVQGQQRRGYL